MCVCVCIYIVYLEYIYKCVPIYGCIHKLIRFITRINTCVYDVINLN